jgi:hypothetical protein
VEIADVAAALEKVRQFVALLEHNELLWEASGLNESPARELVPVWRSCSVRSSGGVRQGPQLVRPGCTGA